MLYGEGLILAIHILDFYLRPVLQQVDRVYQRLRVLLDVHSEDGHKHQRDRPHYRFEDHMSYEDVVPQAVTEVGNQWQRDDGHSFDFPNLLTTGKQ